MRRRQPCGACGTPRNCIDNYRLRVKGRPVRLCRDCWLANGAGLRTANPRVPCWSCNGPRPGGLMGHRWVDQDEGCVLLDVPLCESCKQRPVPRRRPRFLRRVVRERVKEAWEATGRTAPFARRLPA